MEDKYIKVGNINTRYWQAGNNGPVIVLVHGFAASVEYWQYNILSLAKCARVYALDLVGFGRTDKPTWHYTGPVFAEFVRDFMDSLQIDLATVVGHSLGGAVVLHFAFNYANRLKKLVLVSSAGFGRNIPWEFRLLTLPIIGDLLAKPNRRIIAAAIRSHAYDPKKITDEFIDQLFELAKLPGVQHTLLSVLRSHANFFGVLPKVFHPILEQAKSVKVPTLIIWGKQDSLLSVKHAYVAKESLSHARLEVLDQCGHVVQIEQAETFAQLVESFIC